MFPEYRDIHSLVMQDVARKFDKAFDNFYRRIKERNNGKNIKAGFPRFKSRDRYNSITYTQSGFRIMHNGHVWLSKIGEIRMFIHRSITGDIKTLSIKKTVLETDLLPSPLRIIGKRINLNHSVPWRIFHLNRSIRRALILDLNHS
jgi:transposase